MYIELNSTLLVLEEMQKHTQLLKIWTKKKRKTALDSGKKKKNKGKQKQQQEVKNEIPIIDEKDDETAIACSK